MVQVGIIWTDLNHGHCPQIFAASAPHPGSILNVNAKTIAIFTDPHNPAILIVIHGIVNSRWQLALAPNAHLKAKSWRHIASPFPLKIGWAVRRFI